MKQKKTYRVLRIYQCRSELSEENKKASSPPLPEEIEIFDNREDARRKLTAERTYSFELYYKGGWSVSSIAAFRKIDRRTVDAEIRAMENVMFVGYRE